MSIRERRKALGWSRAELAERAAIDRRIVQLIELDQWTEADALARVDEALRRAEAGDTDVRLNPVQPPEGAPTIGRDEG